jgi:D-glycero-D-manno-heptose 1,7-bisphosphate phosphatase
MAAGAWLCAAGAAVFVAGLAAVFVAGAAFFGAVLAAFLAGLAPVPLFGFAVVVVTNQPDISNGNSSNEIVNALHKEIALQTGIENFYICPHIEDDHCLCRKPKPGLLFEAAKALNIDLSKSYMVGDRWRDVEAGQTAGCNNFFIDYNYSEKRPSEPFVTVSSLLHAVDLILGEK